MAGVGGLFLLVVVITKRRALAVRIFFVAAVLSLLAEPLHTIFDILRWLATFMLVPLGIAGIKHANLAFWCLFIYSLLGLAFFPFAPDITWALMNGALNIAAIVGLGGVMFYCNRTHHELLKLMRFIGWLGLVFVSITFIFSVFGYEVSSRNDSITVRSGQLSIASAMFLSVFIWRLVTARHLSTRIIFLVGCMMSMALMVISGQRIGFALAGPAFVFYLWPIRKKSGGRLFLALLGISVAFVLGAMFFGSGQIEYMLLRFQGKVESRSLLTGRDELWQLAWNEVKKSPFIGRGMSSDTLYGRYYLGHSFHNSYLAMWFNTGILGLLLFLFALITSAFRNWRLSLKILNHEHAECYRVLTGIVMGCLCAGMFERTLAGASNYLIGVVMLSIAASSKATKDSIYDQSEIQEIDDDWARCVTGER